MAASWPQSEQVTVYLTHEFTTPRLIFPCLQSEHNVAIYYGIVDPYDSKAENARIISPLMVSHMIAEAANRHRYTTPYHLPPTVPIAAPPIPRSRRRRSVPPRSRQRARNATTDESSGLGYGSSDWEASNND